MTKTNKISEVPMTQKILFGVRDEINSKFLSLDHKVTSYNKRFDSIEYTLKAHDKRFDSIEYTLKAHEKRFDSIDLKLKAHDRRFDQLDSKIDSNQERLMSEIHRIGVLVEEQNNRNRIVMDGLTNLFERQDRVEKLVTEKLRL